MTSTATGSPQFLGEHILPELIELFVLAHLCLGKVETEHVEVVSAQTEIIPQATNSKVEATRACPRPLVVVREGTMEHGVLVV